MTTTTTQEQDPFAIEPCVECGAEDAEYGQHEPGCPSGYPIREDPERAALQDSTREWEDAAMGFDANWTREGP